MKQKIILLCMVLLGGWAAQAQSEMGLLIGGGAGTFNYKFQKDIPTQAIGQPFDAQYCFDVHVGYRLRLQQGSRFFWDFDGLVGYENQREGIFAGYIDGYVNYKDGDRNHNLYAALSPTFNWQFYQGAYLGAGLEPTGYFYRSDRDNWHFDMPLQMKLGYRFPQMSVEAACKIGLLKNAQEPLLESNRRTTFQLSIYIPLFK